MKYAFPAGDAAKLDKESFIASQTAIARSLARMVPVKQAHTAVCGGAHIGIFPKVLSGFFASVLAFEPDRENFAAMMKNLNGVRNVRAVNAALMQRAGMAVMQPNVMNRECSFILPNILAPGVNSVDCVMLDAFGLMACDLLQLDVNGCELYALEGAMDTIYKHQPLIMVEVNDSAARYGHTLHDVSEWLKARHYMEVPATVGPYDHVYRHKDTQ